MSLTNTTKKEEGQGTFIFSLAFGNFSLGLHPLPILESVLNKINKKRLEKSQNFRTQLKSLYEEMRTVLYLLSVMHLLGRIFQGYQSETVILQKSVSRYMLNVPVLLSQSWS